MKPKGYVERRCGICKFHEEWCAAQGWSLGDPDFPNHVCIHPSVKPKKIENPNKNWFIQDHSQWFKNEVDPVSGVCPLFKKEKRV